MFWFEMLQWLLSPEPNKDFSLFSFWSRQTQQLWHTWTALICRSTRTWHLSWHHSVKLSGEAAVGDECEWLLSEGGNRSQLCLCPAVVSWVMWRESTWWTASPSAAVTLGPHGPASSITWPITLPTMTTTTALRSSTSGPVAVVRRSLPTSVAWCPASGY